MAPSSALAQQIYSAALAQGVPPAIALGVAQQESGINQWTPSGNLVTGSAGEIGVFQLMPATADGLGVDPTDVDQNIQGGLSLLAQLYQKYGNWTQALSAYNSGSPTGSPSYAASVLGLAQNYDVTASALTASASTLDDYSAINPSDSGGIDPNAVVLAAVVLVGLGIWWMER